MGTKHTPGPWTWGQNYNGLYGAGKDNEVLCHAPYEGMWLRFGDQSKANAKLIAAAPDLLEALVSIYDRRTDETMEKARAAIKKATE